MPTNNKTKLEVIDYIRYIPSLLFYSACIVAIATGYFYNMISQSQLVIGGLAFAVSLFILSKLMDILIPRLVTT